MHLTTISFPDIQLSQRDGHKLRGYFSTQFGRHSDLWHNHREDGKPIYRYPLIQYKVVDRTPRLVGLEAGARLLIDHFLSVSEIRIDELVIPVHSKQVKSTQVDIGVNDQLYTYRFATPWFALNPDTHKDYIRAPKEKQQALLQRILVGHILRCMGGLGYRADKQVIAKLMDLQTVHSKFKGRKMDMFKGLFVTNAHLPSLLGLGKSTARGFGTIIQEP